MSVIITESELMHLSTEFYKEYDAIKYPEILNKPLRVYDVAVFDGPGDYYICIPFRSDMNKKSSAYYFKNSLRSKRGRSGLDFEKMVIVKDTKYLNDKDPVYIDSDEYNEFASNKKFIESQAIKYLLRYIKHITGEKPLSKDQYRKNYQFTSLKYFHKELGIE